MVNAVNGRSGSKMVSLTVTFDLASYFCTFSIQAIYLEWLKLATSFSVWRYI